MELFINDVIIRLHRYGNHPKQSIRNVLLYPLTSKEVNPNQRIWMQYPAAKEVCMIVNQCYTETTFRPYAIDIVVRNYNHIKQCIISQFSSICAAGGIVKQKDEVLLIYRLNKWDLPKGKVEKGESYVEAAQREIAEECNIKVKMGEKFCVTWHTYPLGSHNMIKETHWYGMDLVDDTNMRPCLAESIEKIKWIPLKDTQEMLKDTYRSIQFVFQKYTEHIAENK